VSRERRAARYRRRLAADRDAASVHRALARRRQGEDREILLALARAEERHAAHWAAKLHPSSGRRAGSYGSIGAHPGHISAPG
jgi:vacuolar iron transporter family protein